jgi:hypothetical protein
MPEGAKQKKDSSLTNTDDVVVVGRSGIWKIDETID